MKTSEAENIINNYNWICNKNINKQNMSPFRKVFFIAKTQFSPKEEGSQSSQRQIS